MGQSHSGYEEITQKESPPPTFQQILDQQTTAASTKKHSIVQQLKTRMDKQLLQDSNVENFYNTLMDVAKQGHKSLHIKFLYFLDDKRPPINVNPAVYNYVGEVLQIVSQSTPYTRQVPLNEHIKRGIMNADKRMITTYYKQWIRDEVSRYADSIKARDTGVKIVMKHAKDFVELNASW